jgi:hypothetical protein|tara:strand:+ start:599 stop:937 length:339 start_codon:yes stop_codon:yes gene_type:complete
MANKYEWTIHVLDVHPTEDELSNVVYNLHWRLTATSDELDPEGNAYKSSSIGTQVIGSPDPDHFTSFDDLTKSEVEGWLESSELDIDLIKSSLDNQIKQLITPTSISKNAPW